MAQEVVCEMLNYLCFVVAALVLGTFGGLITEFIGQARWFSVCVGLITAGVTFGLGAAKTTLEIKDKWLDIRRKKRTTKSQRRKFLPLQKRKSEFMAGYPTGKSQELHISSSPSKERLLPRDFVVGVTEEKSREESR